MPVPTEGKCILGRKITSTHGNKAGGAKEINQECFILCSLQIPDPLVTMVSATTGLSASLLTQEISNKTQTHCNLKKQTETSKQSFQKVRTALKIILYKKKKHNIKYLVKRTHVL